MTGYSARTQDISEQLEKFLKEYKAELYRAGKELRSEPIPALTEELFALFETTGNRLKYERAYFKRRKMLSVFGILAILDKREEDVKALEKILEAICEESCWALPAHVNRQYKGWQISIDLFAAETAFYLAEITELLGNTLSENIRERVKEEVFRRVLNPFINSKMPYADWEICQNNWCAVCNGAIGGAAIRLIKEESVLEPVLERICAALTNYIDGFSEDGGCPEGIGYYTYGFSFFVAFAELLREHTKGKNNLLAGDKIRKIALFQQICFLPEGGTICFSDASSGDAFRVGLTACLKMHYPEVEFPDFSVAANLESDDCFRYLILSRDIFFTEQYLKEVKEQSGTVAESRLRKSSKEKQICLPDAQWSISISENDCVLAIKGGHNDEPHNHNDVGSFFYMSEGHMILADLGAGEYTKQYFGDKRYEILCCRSLGHNLPVVFGLEQKTGEKYKAMGFVCDGNGKTCMDLEQAYGLQGECSIRRCLQFDLKDGTFVLEDTFILKQFGDIVENLVTQYEPLIVENGFLIKVGSYAYEIRCFNAENLRILKEVHTNHQGIKEDVWLMQYDVCDVTGENKNTRIVMERTSS